MAKGMLMFSALQKPSWRWFTVVTTLLLAACDSGTSTKDSGAVHESIAAGAALPVKTDELLDPVALLTDLEKMQLRFTTLDSQRSVDAKWFCSFSNESEFLSRSVIVLDAEGNGSLDMHSVSWETTTSANLTLASSEWTMQIENIVFSNRLTVDDRFEGRVQENVKVTCDWSGAHRSETEALLDQLNGSVSGFENELDPEISSRLLTVLNNGTDVTAWQCEMWEMGALADVVEYQFFTNNLGFGVFEFNWYAINEESIRLVYGNTQFDIEKFEFFDSTFNSFKAQDSRGYDLDCVRV